MDYVIRQCRVCGRIFQAYGSNVCNNCTEEMDKAFIKVRDYIYKHPNADILEITKKTEVPEKWILDFLKEERLELQNVSMVLTCEQCGKPVITGRFCKACISDLSKVISSSNNSRDIETSRKETDTREDISFRRTSKTYGNQN